MFASDGPVNYYQWDTFASDGLVSYYQWDTFASDGPVSYYQWDTFASDGPVSYYQWDTFASDGPVSYYQWDTFASDGPVSYYQWDTFASDGPVSYYQWDMFASDGPVSYLLQWTRLPHTIVMNKVTLECDVERKVHRKPMIKQINDILTTPSYRNYQVTSHQYNILHCPNTNRGSNVTVCASGTELVGPIFVTVTRSPSEAQQLRRTVAGRATPT